MDTGRTTIYNMLEIDSTCSVENIRKKYLFVISKLHPDKISIDDPDRILKLRFVQKLNKLYDLVKTPEAKARYDESINENFKKSRYEDLKSDFDKYMDLQSKDVKDKKDVAILFKKMVAEKDKEIDFNPDDKESLSKMDQSEFKKRLNDITMSRNQETIELAPKKILNPDALDPKVFNKLFENQYKKNNKIVPIEQVDTIDDYIGEKINQTPLDATDNLFDSNAHDTANYSKFTLDEDDIPDLRALPTLEEKDKDDSEYKKINQSELDKRMKDYQFQTQELKTVNPTKEIDKGFVHNVVDKLIEEQYKDDDLKDDKDMLEDEDNELQVSPKELKDTIDDKIIVDERKKLNEKLSKLETKKKKIQEKLKKLEDLESKKNDKEVKKPTQHKKKKHTKKPKSDEDTSD